MISQRYGSPRKIHTTLVRSGSQTLSTYPSAARCVVTTAVTIHIHYTFFSQVWPAYWTTSPLWPDDREIDIIKGINAMMTNQMALHTLSGCTHAPNVTETGTLDEDDCLTPSGE